jgi:hypothetical protein
VSDVKLSDVERQALMKLPMRLRVMLAPFFKWPELGVDRRGKHWKEKAEAKEAASIYVVVTEDGRKLQCTLEEAARKAGVGLREVEEAALAAKRWSYRHAAIFTTRFGDVSVRLAH